MRLDLCAHEDFQAEVDVHRIEDAGKFRCDVRVKCKQCGQPFRFIGAPHGINLPVPCLNIDGLELSAEIEPEDVKRFAKTIPIYMPKLPERT